jgi:hypothetical protein
MGLTITKMTIQMGCAGKLGWAVGTELGLRELWDVPPMRAHTRDRSILLVLDGVLPGRNRRRRGHRLLLWGRGGCHHERAGSLVSWYGGKTSFNEFKMAR